MRASLPSTIKIYRCLLCNESIGIYRKLLVLWMSMDFLHWSIKYYTKGRKLWCYQCYQVYICLSSYVFFPDVLTHNFKILADKLALNHLGEHRRERWLFLIWIFMTDIFLKKSLQYWGPSLDPGRSWSGPRSRSKSGGCWTSTWGPGPGFTKSVRTVDSLYLAHLLCRIVGFQEWQGWTLPELTLEIRFSQKWWDQFSLVADSLIW